MATDPWMSRQMAHDAAWVRLEAQIAAVTEAALAEVLAKLWRMILGERPAITAAAAQPPSLDGVEQAARDTWHQALNRWVRPILFAAYADRYGDQVDLPQNARDVWWADTVLRLTETADKVIEALRVEVASAPAESIDQLRDRIAQVLSLDAATKSIRDRIEDVEDQLASVRLSRSEADELLAKRVRLQAELFRTQASRARSKAYLALAQALPEDQDQFRDLARQAARSAGDESRVDRELAVVDAELFPGDELSPSEENRERDRLASLQDDAVEDSETWRNKARLIARTESTNVLNEATLQAGVDAAQASGEELIKVWLSSRDERVRETHAPVTGAHGQVQPIGQPFTVGGSLLMRPGDPDGPPEEVINCRCTITVLTREEHEEIAAVLAAATVEEAMTTSPGDRPADELPIGFRGIFAPLDRPTGDGRQLATPPGGEVKFRQQPWPMLWQPAMADGHDGAVVVGKAAKFWVEDGMVWGQGPFDLESPDGREAARLLARGFINGLSIDPDDVTVEWDEENELAVYTDWRIMGGTLLPYPAFDEARLEPIYASDLDLTLVASLMASAGEPSGWEGEEKLYRAEWFEDQDLQEVTPLTITADGRVFGHVADRSTCHIAIGTHCQLAPYSKTGYAYFHTGEIPTTQGMLPIGKLTVGGGHAHGNAGYAAAAAHYDNATAAVAVVRAYDHKIGVEIAGQLIHDVAPGKVSQLRMSPLSGDWRPVGGNLEMVAALGVNVGGFPIPRETVVVAGGQVQSLVAAGVVPQLSEEERIAGEVRAALRREDRAVQLAARVGLDPRSRAEALAARAGMTMNVEA